MAKVLIGNVKGPSAYDIAVAAGYVGSEAQWLVSLQADAFPLETGITYSSGGDVETVTEDGITITYTYDVDGNVATDERNGVTRLYSYDPDGNLTGIEAV